MSPIHDLDFFTFPNHNYNFIIPHSLKQPSREKTVTIDDNQLRAVQAKVNIPRKQIKKIIFSAFQEFELLPDLPKYRKIMVKSNDPKKLVVCELLFDKNYRNVTAYLSDEETFNKDEDKLSNMRIVPKVTILLTGRKITIKVAEAERVEAINSSDLRTAVKKTDLTHYQQAAVAKLRKIFHSIHLDKRTENAEAKVFVHFRQRMIGTLRELFDNGITSVNLNETFKGLAETLRDLKTSSLIHNFLNLDSIGLDKNGQPIVIDLTHLRTSTASQSYFYTTNNGYLAPEIIDAEFDWETALKSPKVETYASDMWAMGSIFYTLYTSKKPAWTYLEEAALELLKINSGYQMNYEMVMNIAAGNTPRSPSQDINEIERLIDQMCEVLSSIKTVSLKEMNDTLEKSLKPLFDEYCALSEVLQDDISKRIIQAVCREERVQCAYEATCLYNATLKLPSLFKDHLDRMWETMETTDESGDPMMKLICSMLTRDPKKRIDPETLLQTLDIDIFSKES